MCTGFTYVIIGELVVSLTTGPEVMRGTASRSNASDSASLVDAHHVSRARMLFTCILV